jgi:hypothetical protein
MASLLVFVELCGGSPVPAGRSALGAARRLADARGATVYAIVGSADALDEAALEGLERTLGAWGADKILACLHPTLGAPAGFEPLLSEAARRLRPRYLVLPGGGLAAALGPTLARGLAGRYEGDVPAERLAEAGADEVEAPREPTVLSLLPSRGAPAPGGPAIGRPAPLELVSYPSTRAE